ncbi:MAG: hypothetical protein ABFQ62_02585 [Patescibacteria group bacterium]
MIAILILISSFFLGLSTAKFTKLKFYKLELISFSIILGFIFFTWLSFILILFLGYKLGIIFSLVISFLIFYKNKFKFHFLPARLNALAFGGLFFILFAQLFYTHMLQNKPDGLYSGGGSWGDLALHSTYINKFAQQNKFDLSNPVFSTQKTNYPFLINFYSGLLVKYGLSLQLSLIVTGFLLSLASIQLLYFLILKITKSSLTSWLGSLIFYFNGGLGFIYFFQDWLKSQKNIFSFLFSMKVEYAHLADKNIHWSNIIADYILPQRGFVIGLAIFLLVINLWREYFLSRARSRDENKNSKLLILSSIIIGLTPLFHTHTFLTLLGLQIWLSFFEIIKNKSKVKFFVINFGLLILLSTPQLYWQLSGTQSQHFSKLNYAWMKKEDMSLIWFWLKNMGLGFLFLTLGNIYFLKKYRKKFKLLSKLLIAALILFVITNIVSFQPHVYDNMKFMIYAWLITAITTAILLNNLIRKSRLLFIIIFIFLNLTGFLSVLRESYTSWQIIDNKNMEIAEQIKNLTPADAIFLTSDDHNHLVPMLTGRSIVMGYRGWLWTHGIDYSQTERDIAKIFRGDKEAKNLLKKYNINYVYIGRSEKEKFKANTNFYENNYKKIYSNKNVSIYEI